MLLILHILWLCGSAVHLKQNRTTAETLDHQTINFGWKKCSYFNPYLRWRYFIDSFCPSVKSSSIAGIITASRTFQIETKIYAEEHNILAISGEGRPISATLNIVLMNTMIAIQLLNWWEWRMSYCNDKNYRYSATNIFSGSYSIVFPCLLITVM